MVSFSLQLEISKHLDGQLLNVQDLFDGLLNYISCTTEEIIQTANILQEGCSEAKLVLEKLKKHGILNREFDTNKPRNNNIPRTEQSLLGKRSNPFIDIDKETVLQPDLEPDNHLEITISQPQRIIEEESAQSIDLESNDEDANTEEYDADFSTSIDSPLQPPKTYEDKATQTTPIIPINFLLNEFNFVGPFNQPEFTFANACDNTRTQEQNFNENDDEFLVEKLPNAIQPEVMPPNQLVLIQPVYFIQPIEVIKYLPAPSEIKVNCTPPEVEKIDKIQEM